MEDKQYFLEYILITIPTAIHFFLNLLFSLYDRRSSPSFRDFISDHCKVLNYHKVSYFRVQNIYFTKTN